MRNLYTMALIVTGLALVLVGGCSEDCTNPQDPAPPTEAQFAGSATCGTVGCHETKHTEWEASGHPYKLTKIEGAAPTASFPPFSAYPNDAIDPPQGLTWADVTYTIGGYGWKMRWLDENGYILTSGAAAADAQYNFEVEAYGTYHTDNEPGSKPYDCGKCHTTGWVADETPDDGDISNNQDGLVGIHGTFFAGGVHCEECHGKGSLHAASPTTVDMLVDDSSAMCGRCHTRDSLNRIAASGGYVRHHEQYDEWLHSPHALLGGPGCNDCHDAHASVVYDDVAPGDGMLTTCTDCHDATEYALHADHPSSPTCTQCHMPEAAKSAVYNPDNIYDADVTSHILAINTDAVGRTDGMFTEDGKFVRTENELAKITLDFACYGCHSDPATGDGGDMAGPKDLATLSALAQMMHPNSTKALGEQASK